ncbi:MAG: LysM peptidoglycan-binding domain-containing protein [Akkermansiaceae bacterium]|nr:LysM peptidoglycan-binding domain-containing protein [Akkermansiaceae bacterium]
MKKRPDTLFHTPTIKVKRQAPARRFLKRLSAVTRGRNQRVAAAAAEDLEEADHSSRISKGLTIIFGVHILAIGAYFFHLNFLSNRTEDPGSVATAVRSEQKAQAPPLINPQDHAVMVVRGDTYATIAATENIDEEALRIANGNRPIAAGIRLIVPPKRITAVLPPAVEALRENPATPARPAADDGLVEANPEVTATPAHAVLVRPRTGAESTPPRAIPVRQSSTTARSYTVRKGDTLWAISRRMKVDQTALMGANGITNPNKIRLGMTLKIPN